MKSQFAASLHSCHFCCSIFLRSFYGFGIRKCICRRESMQSFVEIWNDDDAKSRLFCKTRPRNFKLKPHMCQLSCVFSCCFAEMRLRKLTLCQNYVRYRPEIPYLLPTYIMESRVTNILVFNLKKEDATLPLFFQMKTSFVHLVTWWNKAGIVVVLKYWSYIGAAYLRLGAPNIWKIL